MPRPTNHLANRLIATDGTTPRASTEQSLIRNVLALSRRVHVADRDALERKRTLVAGVCALVHADRGMLSVTSLDPASGRSHVISVITADRSATSEDASKNVSSASVASTAEPAAGGAATRRATADRAATPGTSAPTTSAPSEAASPTYVSYLPLQGVRLMAALTLSRRPAGGRFSVRQRSTADAVLSAFDWLFDHDRMIADADAPGLSPPQRLILQCLLAGYSEQEVADRLAMNPHTARQHVKSVYRALRVSSRGQLLSLWMSDRSAQQ